MADTIEIRIPNIGEFSDIPVLDVLVKVGDTVAAEEALVTLESEKATMDVPSPQAGVVRTVVLKSGDRVSEGTPILTLAPVDGSTAETVAPSSNGAPAHEPVAMPPPVAASPLAEVSDHSVHASPSIRRFARELGVEIGGVRGTGPQGRITREDVQTYVKRVLAAPRGETSGATLGLAPWPKVDFAKFGPIETVELSRIRKLSGPNLHRNWVMIPHVTNHEVADVTELETFRKKLNAENPAVKITMLAFVIKAVVAALRAFPDVNSSLDGETLVLKKYYNIGFAADTPSGLVVPVLRGADTKGIAAIATETAALAAKAREAKLGMTDMQGATFTISSLGGIGGTSFTPIINAPEVAILGVSRATIEPVWDGSAFLPRLMMPLSFSYDHRVIDGALAARFNAYLAEMLSDFRRVLI